MPVRAVIVRKSSWKSASPWGRLRSWLPVTVERLESDLMLQWAVEHGLQKPRSLFDVVSHMRAGESTSPWTSTVNPGAPEARGVLSEETATAY